MTLAVAQKRHARFTVEQFHRLCEAVTEQRLLVAHPQAARPLRVAAPLMCWTPGCIG